MNEQQLVSIITNPKFTHARQGKGLWRETVWLYHRDSASPSGVILAGSGHQDIVDPLLAQHARTSALSPDERGA